MADKPPELPLEHAEFAEVILRGALRDPRGPGRMVALIERFMGMRLGSRRWIVLTNRRLLVLRRRDPGSYRPNDWFDVSLDRTAIAASMPYVQGSLVVLGLVSRLGPATLLLPNDSYQEAVRLARLLGAEPAKPDG